MKNSEICPYYVEDSVFIGGAKKRVCTYWDFDNPGLCKHPDVNVCRVFIRRQNIFDEMYLKLIDELSLLPAKPADYNIDFKSFPETDNSFSMDE